jgi:hypothetical protein
MVEVISHHFRYNLFVRSKLLGPAHAQWEGILQGMYTRSWAHWGPFLEQETKVSVTTRRLVCSPHFADEETEPSGDQKVAHGHKNPTDLNPGSLTLG